MTGTALILLLTVLICNRLRDLPPAARVATGYVLGIGIPVGVLCLLARLGVSANRFVVGFVFAAVVGVLFATSPKKRSSPDDPRWIGVLALTFAAAAITALIGRSPAQATLVDPWAHIAWSRNLPGALELYPSGFPAFFAILGLDDRLVGAFRLAPVILQAALTAQFLALGERVRALWPATVCAMAYLVVPAAFGKFDPPRPELWAAVLIVASWWIVCSTDFSVRWKCLALGGITCVLVASHLAYLEIAHLTALGLTILWGDTESWKARRLPLLLSLALGAMLSLVISPWPLVFMSRLESVPLATNRESAAQLLHPIALARMLGLMLSVAGAASIVWVGLKARTAYRHSNGVLPGLCAFGIFNLIPLFMIAAGIDVPISFEAYRFVLAAALPLAMVITIVAGLVGKRMPWGHRVFVALTAVFVLDVITRPAFSWMPGVAAGAIALITAWSVRRVSTRKTWVAASIVAFAAAVGVRLLIWFPSPPSEAAWLVERGDPNLAVVTNWPLTNALDALVPQRVIDGLAGDDGNVAHHRAWTPSPLHDRLTWCGEHADISVDSLRVSLGRMDALPAYLVVGDRFAESWQLYAMQREDFARTGRLGLHPYYAAEPCSQPAAARVSNMRHALESHPSVRREFSAEHITVYRMD